MKVLLGDLLERVESREGCCPCMKGELPAPMDALKLELEAKLSVMRRDVRVIGDKVLQTRDGYLEFKKTVTEQMAEK